MVQIQPKFWKGVYNEDRKRDMSRSALNFEVHRNTVLRS